MRIRRGDPSLVAVAILTLVGAGLAAGSVRTVALRASGGGSVAEATLWESRTDPSTGIDDLAKWAILCGGIAFAFTALWLGFALFGAGRDFVIAASCVGLAAAAVLAWVAVRLFLEARSLDEKAQDTFGAGVGIGTGAALYVLVGAVVALALAGLVGLVGARGAGPDVAPAGPPAHAEPLALRSSQEDGRSAAGDSSAQDRSADDVP
jgi:hypothetical protein